MRVAIGHLFCYSMCISLNDYITIFYAIVDEFFDFQFGSTINMAFMNIFFFLVCVCIFIEGIILGIEFLSHRICISSFVLNIAKSFSNLLYQFSHPLVAYERSPHPGHFFLFLTLSGVITYTLLNNRNVPLCFVHRLVWKFKNPQTALCYFEFIISLTTEQCSMRGLHSLLCGFSVMIP